MKKSKILSVVLALAMSLSVVPTAVIAADTNVIYSEDFDGETKEGLQAQGYTLKDDSSRIEIADNRVVAKTSVGGSGFNFNFLSAEAKELVRVTYDVKLSHNGYDVNKSALKTDAGDIPLIAFGAYGSINQDYDHVSWTGTNTVGGVNYWTHWYNVDLLLDFDNNTITVNLKNLDDGSMAISDHVWNYDLSGINTIKGFHTYGWTHGDVADTGYDNLLIEYVERPDPNIIYSEDFDGETKEGLKSQGYTLKDDESRIEIADNKVVAKTSVGGSGFNFNFLSAEAKGLVGVTYDVKLSHNGYDVNRSLLKTDAGDIPLIFFSAYGTISQDYDLNSWTATLNEVEGVKYWTHWYNVDLLLDFDNNTITVNLNNLDDGSMAISDHVWNYDLSGINTIKGFETYGWTHGNVEDTGYDNLLIEYVERPDPNIIYSEDFDGETKEGLKSQGYTLKDDESRIEIADNKVVAKTSVGGSGFNFNFLSAEAKELVRVTYDVKLSHNGYDVNRSLLKTDAGDIPLIFFSAYGTISQDYDLNSWTATLNEVEGVKYWTHWYNVDLLLDFDNNTITVNLKNLDDGSMAISDLVWNYDLSGVNTIKGFETYGWTHGNVEDTGYDNLLIEYVTEETPDEPEFKTEILSENFDGKVLTDIAEINDAAPEIVDGVVQTAASGGGGFSIKSLNADAKGQIRVKFDMKAPNVGTAATTTKIYTDAADIPLVSYGVWGGIRPTAQEDPIGGAGFTGDTWYVNDIVLDFDNNKIIYTITEKENGVSVLSGYERDYDLSAFSKIKGFQLYGWAGTAYLDNLVIEYVTEETPDEPDTPELNAEILTEIFDGKVLTDIAEINDAAPEIVDGVVQTAASGAGGFSIKSLNADAKGQIRVKFDMKAPNVDTAATTTKIYTDASEIPLVSYGVWGGIRPTAQEDPIGGAGFTGDTWYVNDIVLDFDNNKIIYTITEKESGASVLSGYERDYDLSAFSKIKGFQLYGWAGTAYLDNLVIEYVTEETPDTPDEPGEIEVTIYEENFDGKTKEDLKSQGYTLKDNDSRIEIADNKMVAKTSEGGSGFVFNFLSAAANGQVRVKYDLKLYNNSFDVNRLLLKTDAGDIPLIVFGAYGSISQDYDLNSWTATLNKVEGVGYGTYWYNVDLLLDFDNNTITVNMENLDEGTMAISDHVWNYDLSSINTIKGLDTYGWTHGDVEDTGYDNLLIEYASEDPTISSDRIKIYSGEDVQKHSSVTPGSDKIVIDFVGVLKASTLENAVTIKNVTDNADVTYTAEVKGSKYIITLSEGLAASKQYKITVSGDVENIFGVKLGAEYTLSFITNAGFIKINGITLKQNDIEVTSFAGLAQGQEAKVTVNYDKTSKEEKIIKLIYAYYNGTELVKSVVKTITIGAGDKSGTKEDTVTVEDLTGITGVSVMLWENFTSIKPLCQDIKL